MALRYKINIFEALKKSGLTTYKIRKEKIFSESTVQKLRKNDDQPLSWDNINTICSVLHCQPGEIIEYVPEED